MRSLAEIYHSRITPDGFPDKGTIHSYIEVYEEVFRPYRSLPLVVLEIGILGGDSLLMWEEYFLNSKVYGVDLTDQPLGKYNLRPLMNDHNILIMDASDKEQVYKNLKDIRFDIIIDDASHNIDHQIITYHNFKSLLNKESVYIIEDIQDIDKERYRFESLGAVVLDRRSIKNRYDDVLAIIK